MSDEFKQLVRDLQLGIRSEFVPWSKSRSFQPGTPITRKNLNWKVTFMHHGQKEILTTDYSAGLAYGKVWPKINRFWKLGLTIMEADAVEYEVEKGRDGSVKLRSRSVFERHGDPLLPNPHDAIASLAMDSGAIDYANYEEFAAGYGYDPDSRKGEKIYRECLEHALVLRAALGDANLQKLRELAHEQ